MIAYQALEQIDRSDLSASQYRAARRLLDRCHDIGALTLGHDQAMAVCVVASMGALRRMLIALKKAGIVEYTVNGQVFVRFTAWDAPAGRDQKVIICQESVRRGSESDHIRAKSDHGMVPETTDPRAKSDHIRAKSDLLGSESDPNLTEFSENVSSTYTHARARWLVGRLYIDPSMEDRPTNQPHERLGVGLLRAVGVRGDNATRLAAAHPLATIQRAVGHYWDNPGDKFKSPGIIVSWLDDWPNAGIPELSSAFRASALYREWRPPEERAEVAAAAAALVPLQPAIEDPDPLVLSELTQDPWADLWGNVTQGIANADPSLHGWIDGTTLAGVENGTATIQVPPMAVDWIENRLGRRLVREMRSWGVEVERVTVEAQPCS